MENQTRISKEAFILGWNGLKDIIKPGDSIGIASMAHDYKTGAMLSLISQIARLNKPANVQPQQKPLVFHLSTEDTLNYLYSSMYHLLKNAPRYNESHSPINPLFYEKVAYVQQQMGVNGFHYEPGSFERQAGLTLDISDNIQRLYNHYEKDDCPVEVLAVDGMGNGYCQVVQNFCKEKQTTLLTTLQISPEARQLERSGVINPEDFLDAVASKVYIVGYADIHLDVVLYTHVTRCKGARYLAVKVGKCRRPPSGSEQLKTFFMEFPSSGVIPDQDPEDGVMFELPSIS